MTGPPVGQAGGTSTLPAEPVGQRQRQGPGSLLRAEAHRFLSRRFIRLLVALAAVGMLGGVVLASTQFAMTTPQELARATENRAAVVAEQDRFRESCVRESSPATAEQRCGPAPTEADFGGLEQFLDRPPFTLQERGLPAIVGVAALSAALAFVIGATSIGAEWSTRSIVALLFWEPRRLRVVASKLAVLVGATATLGLVAHGGWLVAAWLLARTRGSTAAPDGLWSDMLAASGRGVLLTVLGGLFGFGAANLLRSTAACLGVAFVYVAVIESLVRGLVPARQRWLLADNAIALVQRGGHRIYVDEGFVDEFGNYCPPSPPSCSLSARCCSCAATCTNARARPARPPGCPGRPAARLPRPPGRPAAWLPRSAGRLAAWLPDHRRAARPAPATRLS